MARPMEFNPDEAIDRAIDYFSRHTYHGTNVRDLARHMGIRSSSFYNTFGDKRQVYVLALARYLERLRAEQNEIYAQAEASVDGLHGILSLAIDSYLTSPSRGDWGLFAVNATLEMILQDAEVRALLVSNQEDFNGILESYFVRCQQAGTIAPTHSPQALARFMVGVITSLTTMARLAPDRQALEDMITVALDALT